MTRVRQVLVLLLDGDGSPFRGHPCLGTDRHRERGLVARSRQALRGLKTNGSEDGLAGLSSLTACASISPTRGHPLPRKET
jgi:hypothetical protein